MQILEASQSAIKLQTLEQQLETAKLDIDNKNEQLLNTK